MTSPITPTIGWQPIETAPDDDVLLLGWWANVLGSRSWECEVEYYARDNGEYSATHWMPLPDPPEALVRQEK